MVTRAVQPFISQAAPPCSSPSDRRALSHPVARLFSYATPDVPLAETTEARWTDREFEVERVSYATGPLTRTAALVVGPASGTRPLPGVVALHCHSGIYRWGKEKVCATPGEWPSLQRFREQRYGGRSLAHDLAARGFVVVAPDAFYFGSRALGGADGNGAAVEAHRKASEGLVAKILNVAGHSWPAIIAWEDRRALQYLCGRPDVDAERIGVLGLSLGGFRSVLLAAQDRRVGAVVTAGWLTTMADLLAGHIIRHSWTVLPGGVLPDLDLSDIVAGAHPAAFLALLCRRDHLFSVAGMEAAAAAVVEEYRRRGAGAPVACEFHDVPHGMTAAMQERAADWMEEFLRAGRS